LYFQVHVHKLLPVTPDLAEQTQQAEIAVSPAGMTSRVVKGSLWTLVGQAAPLLVSLVATPFTIRLLGSEAYGVLILVNLIPTYFAFADFGMGIASTKFGSEAYGEGNRGKEGSVVRVAALIALICSLVVAVPIFTFSSWIISQFSVPENFQFTASIALKIASISFVLGLLGLVLNTPMLARLRMDLNSVTSAVPKILLAAITPIVVYLGGGVVGAVWVGFFAAALGLGAVAYFSGRLLPGLYRLSVDRGFFRPLLKFGGGWVIGSVAAILLVNFEKLTLSRMVSVRSLAYYSVAFTFAGMATMFSSAMLQSLIPAFSQLLGPERKEEFNGLFTRGMRLNIIWLLPAIMLLFIAAKPFFTIWAGEEFGRESTLPFYILLLGLFFNILAYVPHSTITAKGRTDVFAKLYWLELAVYAVLVIVLIKYFGIAGAAAAWSLRVILDAVAIVWLSRRIAGVSFDFLRHYLALVAAAILLVPAIGFAAFYDNFSPWLILLILISTVCYSAVIWQKFIEPGERRWVKGLIERGLRFVRVVG
jgi:O-antigen/teichoic acid export membrane protein